MASSSTGTGKRYRSSNTVRVTRLKSLPGEMGANAILLPQDKTLRMQKLAKHREEMQQQAQLRADGEQRALRCVNLSLENTMLTLAHMSPVTDLDGFQRARLGQGRWRK